MAWSCACTQLLGKRTSMCDDYDKCTRALIGSTPEPDTEALFKKFIDEFPVLSALDVFCNPCARPRAISYHRDIPGLEPMHVHGTVFWVKFSCNCPHTSSMFLNAASMPTKEWVLKALRGENPNE